MAKRIPPACTPANCGENFPVCGTLTTFTHRKCRCDSCSAASSEYHKQHYQAHKDRINERNKQYYEENREAAAERSKRYYEEHREAVLAQTKQYQLTRREAILQRQKRWREANSKMLVDAARQYALENPERTREIKRIANHRRRAKMKAAQVINFTQGQLEQKMAYYGNKCYLQIPGICTGEFDHIDHVKPIAKGGPHMIANFRPACAPCNHRKLDHWPFKLAG